uniref:Ribosomal protein S7 n=1 Tax=Piridium sociabile TaxID=2570542 RepID=A0A5B9XUW3_9ALVE|nr:ribosomal protein S7 [Piridium sociabile]
MISTIYSNNYLINILISKLQKKGKKNLSYKTVLKIIYLIEYNIKLNFIQVYEQALNKLMLPVVIKKIKKWGTTHTTIKLISMKVSISKSIDILLESSKVHKNILSINLYKEISNTYFGNSKSLETIKQVKNNIKNNLINYNNLSDKVSLTKLHKKLLFLRKDIKENIILDLLNN